MKHISLFFGGRPAGIPIDSLSIPMPAVAPPAPNVLASTALRTNLERAIESYDQRADRLKGEISDRQGELADVVKARLAAGAALTELTLAEVLGTEGLEELPA